VRAVLEEREQETRVDSLLERGGELRFLARLLAAPPDLASIREAEQVGWLERSEDEALDALQLEYARLFSVPGAEAIPAHQSLYTDQLELEPGTADSTGCGMAFAGGVFGGFLGGRSSSEAARWYREAGFDADGLGSQLPDHASTELAFLGYLYLAEAQALQRTATEDAADFERLRGQFWSAFPGRWLSELARRLEAGSRAELYRAVARRLLGLHP
jgi:TorA maturation chaperone TorD